MREIFRGSPPGRVAVKGPRVTPRRCNRRAPGRSCRWRSRSPPASRPSPGGRRAWPARRSSACCPAGAATPQVSPGYDRRGFVHNALQIVHASVGASRLLGWACGDERHRWPPSLALASRAPPGCAAAAGPPQEPRRVKASRPRSDPLRGPGARDRPVPAPRKPICACTCPQRSAPCG